jgi:16S rRNA processing protein RimM
VVAIHDFGAGDILELRQEGKRDTVMLPFTSATVPVVDIAGRRIVIDPPDGVFKD